MLPKRKSERLEARVTPELKRQIQHAADLVGRTVTDFTTSSLEEAVAKVIREHEVISVSMHDQEVFIRALFDTADPNDPLLRAKKSFDKKVVNE